MKIRFSFGTGSRHGNRKPTEQGCYVSAAVALFIQIRYFMILKESSSALNFDSIESSVTTILSILLSCLPAFIGIINLIKGIKLTRKRLNLKKDGETYPTAGSGYVYCTQCGCKLLEGIEVCPYCNEPIPHTEQVYEKERRRSFEEADPEQKKKPNVLMIISVAFLIIAVTTLIIYNVSNPYKGLESWEFYDMAEEIMADVTKENIGELGNLIEELESRDYLDWETLKEDYTYIQETLAIIEEYAVYDNTANLRSTFAELIDFDRQDDFWNLERLTDRYLEKHRQYLLFGKTWAVGEDVFYWREEDEEGYLRATLPNDKKYGITYYFGHRIDEESGFVIFYYETEDGDTFDAYQVQDVFYDETMGWTAYIYAISNEGTYVMH